MSKKKHHKKPNPDAQKVQDMIKETLFPEVYSMWLDNKITLLSALTLCLNVKMDYALAKQFPEDPEGDEKPEESEDFKGHGDTDDNDE